MMLSALMGASAEESPIRAFARLGQVSEEAQDLKRYFSNNREEVERALHAMIPKLRQRTTATPSARLDIESAKRAMAGLLQVFFSIQKLPIEQTTEKLLSFFGLEGSSDAVRTLTGLQIKGTFPPLDFTNLIVTQSRFQDYRNLMHGRFRNTKFMYSIFEGCADLGCPRTELQSSMIDSGTCSIDDLHEALAVSHATKVGTTAMITAEVVRFFGSFYTGDRFGDKRVDYIKYSNKVQGLAPDRFSRLVAKGYFVLAKSKTVGDFYEVAPTLKPSVRKFLSDGYPDAEIRQFVEFVK